MLKICITGHRDLLNPKDVVRDIAYSLKYFKEIHKELIAISAVAAGADILFTEEAIRQQIPIQIMLPFNLAEYKKDFTGSDLQKLENILQKKPYKVVEESAIKSSDERNNAYLKTGQVMVDNSDIILTVWDGKPASGKGGTGDIIEYARIKNKELHIIKAVRKSEPGKLNQPDEIREIFDWLDKEAIKYKKQKFVRAWIAGIIAGLMAVFSFAIALAFPLSHKTEFIFKVIEFILLIVSFVSLAVFAKKWKSIFLQKRRNAEYLRTVLWYKDAGIPIPTANEIKNKPASEILDIEKKIAAGITKIENIPNAKRIAWCLAQQQIDYHQHIRIIPFKERLERLELWLKCLKIVFFIVTPLNFLFEALKYFHGYTGKDIKDILPYLLFLALILPPLYAALEGIKYFSEWKRDIAVSKNTVAELEKSKRDILLCKDETSLLAETKRLREILELENNDWTIRYYEKEVGARV